MLQKAKRLFLHVVALTFLVTASAQQPSVVHSRIGQTDQSDNGSVRLTLLHKFQSFSTAERETYDADVRSPKSVNIHPSGSKFYVNSLEGFKTVVYEMLTWRKLKVIDHTFDDRHQSLWAPASGLFPFTHYNAERRSLNNFNGKPVEGTFSHGGRYFWVPYYRRSYDINAQDPSAMAVIDTRTDTIIRLFETGPLPKMVACSHDGRTIAVSHWGDNTVATLDISSDQPADWHYTQLYTVDYRLRLDFPLDQSVDRDNGSGYALRGTVFSPDDRYLLVGCMGGSGGIAVVDLQEQQYLGRLLGMRANVRHLVVVGDTLYLSSNAAGVIQRKALGELLDAARQMQGKTATVGGWEECQVMSGARTIELSPSGRFVFAACNGGSRLCVADTRQMRMVCSTAVDSYPVGLDISQDGAYVIVTSQGHSAAGGGNAVNIFSVEYAEPEVTQQPVEEPMPADTATADTTRQSQPATDATPPFSLFGLTLPTLLLIVGGAALLIVLFVLLARKKS